MPADELPTPQPIPLPKSVALLWGRTPDNTRRGPKPTLTIREIAQAAVTVADERGWEAVSMKAIADQLGLTPMSLYRYVDSKDDIVDLLVDEAYGQADPTLTAAGTWRERITAWADAAARGLRERPWLTEIPMSRPPVGPNVLSWTEVGVRAFDETSLSGSQKMSALLLVDGFVRHHVRQATQMGLLSRPGADAADSPTYEQIVGELVDAARFPALSAAIPELSDSDDDYFDDELRFGLAVILDGLATLIEDRSPGR